MYYRVEIDLPDHLNPVSCWLKAESYLDAYLKAKKRFSNRIVAIINVFEFKKVWFK